MGAGRSIMNGTEIEDRAAAVFDQDAVLVTHDERGRVIGGAIGYGTARSQINTTVDRACPGTDERTEIRQGAGAAADLHPGGGCRYQPARVIGDGAARLEVDAVAVGAGRRAEIDDRAGAAELVDAVEPAFDQAARLVGDRVGGEAGIDAGSVGV